ncbi:hypothetical protein LCGC14_1202150 [marine sediment metagenome]|uniref:Nucleotidyltransferase n=1 Tax=marine sediment metagenome TaxID=412755 RepID=A0A0F9NYY6_9ZZZZ
MDDLDIIVKMYFGSHLYGTNTKDSDEDFKGIFLPSKREVILGKISKSHSYDTKEDEHSKNTKEDKDIEIYSLHYFIKLGCEGRTEIFDMLHAPDSMILEKTRIWDMITNNREKFYARDMYSVMEYINRQASKYGLKGSRLNAAKKVLEVLRYYNIDSLKLRDMWDRLPDIQHCRMLGQNPNGIREYQVCGKILQETQKIDYAIGILEKFFEKYGERAKQAAKNKGIDWKAVSHALRAGMQFKQLLTENTITFPLKEADYIIKVKQGKLNYKNEVVPKLEGLMKEVEILSKESKLPEKPDREFWDDFIISCYDSL